MAITKEEAIIKAREFVNQRRIIEGPRNDLMMIAPVKHQFARVIWQKMLDNTWFRNEVDLSEDAKQFPMLAEAEQSVFTDALAFLSNLDGIQFNNLVNNIGGHITSPEVEMCITRQAFEEALHVEAYSTIIETMPGLDPLEIYNRFETDEVLKAKNKNIMAESYKLKGDYSPRNFALAVVANVALEGIYFYSGFLTFYSLARMDKMKESAKMIKFIQRDEETHLDLFVNIWHTLQNERPELFDDELFAAAHRILSDAEKLEINWGQHVIRHGVMGLTDEIVDGFVKHLGDKRRKQLGLESKHNVDNPAPWFDKFASVAGSEENFFEGKVSAYENGALEWD